jgi:hypothetical protein
MSSIEQESQILVIFKAKKIDKAANTPFLKSIEE